MMLPVTLKPLDDVREEIIQSLNDNLALDNANAKAMELFAALQSGESEFETLATESGLEYDHYEAVKRNSSEPDAKLVQEVFRLQAPGEDGKIQAVLPTMPCRA